MDKVDSKLQYNLNLEQELTNLPFPDDFRPEDYLITNVINPPTPPDGGFGWLVVGASFVMNFVIDGINGSVGIVLPSIQEYFHSSIGDTTLVLSMLVLFIYIMAPVAGILLDKFKTRTLVTFFGLAAALSITLSYFAKTVRVVTFTFGVLPGFVSVIEGISFSICVMAAQVMISLYFDKRRALAYSISGIGSGIGSILMPFLTSVIITQNGFRTLYLFWGGICFLLVLIGPLYVQLKLVDEAGTEINDDTEVATIGEESALYMRELKQVSIDYGNLDYVASPRRSLSHQLISFETIPLRSLNTTKNKLKQNFSLISNLNRTAVFSIKPTSLRHNSTVNELGKIYNVLNARRSYVPNSNARNLNLLKNNETSFYNQILSCYTGNATFSGLLSRIDAIIECLNKKRTIKILSYSEGDLFRKKYGNNYVIQADKPLIDKKSLTFLKKWINNLMLKPMNRADIFYKGSRKQLVDQGLIDANPDIRNIIHVPKLEETKTLYGRFSHILSIIVDLSIFKDKCLIIYYVAISLFSWASYIPMFFIVVFAKTFTENARYFPSIIGVGSVLGQLFCGLSISYCRMTPVVLSEMGFYLSAFFTAGIAALQGHFYPMAVISLFFGFCYGTLLATWQSVLCDIVGIRKLTSSISFYLFFRGVSIFIGLYSSSIISEKINIRNTIYLASSILGLSSIIHTCVRLKRNSLPQCI